MKRTWNLILDILSVTAGTVLTCMYLNENGSLSLLWCTITVLLFFGGLTRFLSYEKKVVVMEHFVLRKEGVDE